MGADLGELGGDGVAATVIVIAVNKWSRHETGAEDGVVRVGAGVHGVCEADHGDGCLGEEIKSDPGGTDKEGERGFSPGF